MSKYFAENPGTLEVVPWYADNEICLQEVRFSVPADEWSEFQESDLFQELVEYVHSLETPDTHTCIHEPEYTQENAEIPQNSFCQEFHESFWARVRRWILRILRIQS